MSTNTKVYEIRRPYYSSDQESKKSNPLVPINIISLPGIICPSCGETWSGSRRLYLPIQNEGVRRQLEQKPPLSMTAWAVLASKVKQETGFSGELRPGDVFGTPTYRQTGKLYMECIHAGMGRIIISDNLRNDWINIGLSGWHSKKIDVLPTKQSKEEGKEFFELLIDRNIDQEEYKLCAPICSVCRRESSKIHSGYETIIADEKSLYLFNINRNPNRIFATKNTIDVIKVTDNMTIAAL
jgi:Protein of unknown function (Gmx_para_CXXCG)